MAIGSTGESMARMGSEGRNHTGWRVGAIGICDCNTVISVGPLDQWEESTVENAIGGSKSGETRGGTIESSDCDWAGSAIGARPSDRNSILTVEIVAEALKIKINHIRVFLFSKGMRFSDRCDCD